MYHSLGTDMLQHVNNGKIISCYSIKRQKNKDLDLVPGHIKHHLKAMNRLQLLEWCKHDLHWRGTRHLASWKHPDNQWKRSHLRKVFITQWNSSSIVCLSIHSCLPYRGAFGKLRITQIIPYWEKILHYIVFLKDKTTRWLKQCWNLLTIKSRLIQIIIKQCVTPSILASLCWLREF